MVNKKPKSSQASKLNLYDNVDGKLREMQREHAKDKAKLGSFTKFSNDLFWSYIEQEESIRRVGPFLSWVGAYDNILIVYDYRLRKRVEVQVVDKELHCREDDTTNCIHIGFCYAIPEVYKKLREIGFIPPHPIEKLDHALEMKQIKEEMKRLGFTSTGGQFKREPIDEKPLITDKD